MKPGHGEDSTVSFLFFLVMVTSHNVSTILLFDRNYLYELISFSQTKFYQTSLFASTYSYIYKRPQETPNMTLSIPPYIELFFFYFDFYKGTH